MQTVKQLYDGVESSSWEFLGYDWFLGSIKGKNAKKHDFPMFGNHEKSQGKGGEICKRFSLLYPKENVRKI